MKGSEEEKAPSAERQADCEAPGWVWVEVVKLWSLPLGVRSCLHVTEFILLCPWVNIFSCFPDGVCQYFWPSLQLCLHVFMDVLHLCLPFCMWLYLCALCLWLTVYASEYPSLCVSHEYPSGTVGLCLSVPMSNPLPPWTPPAPQGTCGVEERVLGPLSLCCGVRACLRRPRGWRVPSLILHGPFRSLGAGGPWRRDC